MTKTRSSLRELQISGKMEQAAFVRHCAKKYSLGSCTDFNEYLNSIALHYDGRCYWDSEERRGIEYRNTIAELKSKQLMHSLYRIGEIFGRQGNWSELNDILEGCDDEELPDIHAISRGLECIRVHLMRGPKVARKRGAKSKNHNIFDLVDALAEYWERKTKKPFTANWDWLGDDEEELVPVTKEGSAEFAYEVVHFLDPKALPALRKVMSQVIRRRRTSSKRPLPRNSA